MSVGTKLLQAAAGNAGGDAVYVDDVFSTFLYEGSSSSTQTITNGIKLGNNLAGPSALFTQTSDYLTGTLSGGSNAKTFTFSGWFYKLNDDSNYPFVIRDNSGNTRFAFTLDGGGNNTFGINAYNSSGTKILDVHSSGTAITAGTWHHIMISADLANSSNRYMYLDDVAVSANWGTYTDDNIEFSHGETFVGTFSATQTTGLKTYMSNTYLDYTYRDLSVESNRRLFIASNGTPATNQASLNPILYLSFDSTSLGNNSGTGGNLSTVGSPYYDADFGPYIGTDGEGGLVWIKDRDATASHILFDSEGQVLLNSNGSGNGGTGYWPTYFNFNSGGFTTTNTVGDSKVNGNDYVSWTFRNQEKFFDVVTYTGTGSTQNISHNLGSVPGMIIVKSTTRSDGWAVYHRGLNGGTNPEQYRLYLNVTGAESSNSAFWNNTAPTSAVFTVGTEDMVNSNSDTYVAYLFAHDEQDFGEDSDEAIIKCGGYTGTGSDLSIDLGFEPQWILFKRSNGTTDWVIRDNMRGTTDTFRAELYPNLSDAEYNHASGPVAFTPTGFRLPIQNGYYNTSGDTFIYVAIRRPHKPASEFAATDLFAMDTLGSTGDGKEPGYRSGFPVDMGTRMQPSSTASKLIGARLTHGRGMKTDNREVEGASGTHVYDYNNGRDDDTSTDSGKMSHMWRRAPGFFDVVCYKGAGSSVWHNHNLGVVPEMIWFKGRDIAEYWNVFTTGGGTSGRLHLDEGSEYITNNANQFFPSLPTATQFRIGGNNEIGGSGYNYIAYLFASVDGISKLGTYTGTGSAQDIDCGFSAGARFVLIKRVDVAGFWILFDSLRGIVAGNDPYLFLNTTAAQTTNTDYIDPLSSGFTITSSAPANNADNSMNKSGGTYFFYAIA